MASDDEGDIPRLEQIEPAAVEDIIGSPALPMERYHLRAPTFCGEDVEQFIAEFSDQKGAGESLAREQPE